VARPCDEIVFSVIDGFAVMAEGIQVLSALKVMTVVAEEGKTGLFPV
jgi:hypothetical protein